MNETFLALGREATLAAEHMAIGVTALGKANYAQEAYYGYEASMQTAVTKAAAPYVRMYVMQIIRFISLLLPRKQKRGRQRAPVGAGKDEVPAVNEVPLPKQRLAMVLFG